MHGTVPTYDLYGENHDRRPEFWLHSESIAHRSSLHNWEIRPHRHESFFQILHIRSGRCDVLFEDGSRAVRPPSIITVPPQMVHGFRFSRDIAGSVITLVASRLTALLAGHPRFLGWYGTPRIVDLPDGDRDSAYVDETLARLGPELGARAPAGAPLVEAYLVSALVLSARMAAPETVGMRQARSREAERAEMLSTLIDRHFREQRPVEFYAKSMGLSVTHLNRIAQSAAGMTVHEMLSRRLIDEAKRDLVFTFGSVQSIAYGLGFGDPGYFTRFFSQKTGTTPRDYRRSERERLAG